MKNMSVLKQLVLKRFDMAVEFDFANKWAECIGQALYYGQKTNRTPACVLIIENPTKDFEIRRTRYLRSGDALYLRGQRCGRYRCRTAHANNRRLRLYGKSFRLACGNNALRGGGRRQRRFF